MAAPANSFFVLEKLRRHPLEESADKKYFFTIQDLAEKTAHTADVFFRRYPSARDLFPGASRFVLHARREPLDFSVTRQLSLEGLLLVTAYLKKTKDVDIFVTRRASGAALVVERALSEGLRSFGVICVSLEEEEKEIAHAFPFAVFLTPSGSLQIVDLDSRASRSSFFRALQQKFRLGEFFGTAIPRQADFGNCITDAVVILTDALSQTKREGVSDVKPFLSSHFLDPLVEYQPFLLPKVWSRTVQLLASVSPKEEDPIVHIRRDKATGSYHPETLDAFLARYRVVVKEEADLAYTVGAETRLVTAELTGKSLHGFLRCKSESLRRLVERAFVCLKDTSLVATHWRSLTYYYLDLEAF